MSTTGRDKSGGVLDLHAVPVLRAGVKIEHVGLRAEESTLVNLLDGRRNVGDLLRLSGMSGYVLMHHLRSLHERELVTLMRRPGGRRTEEAFSRGATLTQLPQMTPERPAPMMVSTPAKGTSASGKGVVIPTPSKGSNFVVVNAREAQAAERSEPSAPAGQPAAMPDSGQPERPGPRVLTPSTGKELVAPAPRSIRPPGTSGALPPRRGAPTSIAQELWFAATRREWITLAVVPAAAKASALPVACALVDAGSFFRGRPVELVRATGSDVSTSVGMDWAAGADHRPSPSVPGEPPSEMFERVIVLDSVLSNPIGVSIAQSADAVLVVAEKGETDLSDVQWTVQAIGREHFIGCVLVSSR
jgi:hypothetical protein